MENVSTIKQHIYTDDEIAAMSNVLPEVAGKYLDKTPQYIRVGLQRERLPFGTAVQGRRWSYSIPGAALVRYKHYGHMTIKYDDKNFIQSEKE